MDLLSREIGLFAMFEVDFEEPGINFFGWIFWLYFYSFKPAHDRPTSRSSELKRVVLLGILRGISNHGHKVTDLCKVNRFTDVVTRNYYA